MILDSDEVMTVRNRLKNLDINKISKGKRDKYFLDLNRAIQKEFYKRFKYFKYSALDEIDFTEINPTEGNSDTFLLDSLDAYIDDAKDYLTNKNYIYKKIICKAKDIIRNPKLLYILDTREKFGIAYTFWSNNIILQEDGKIICTRGRKMGIYEDTDVIIVLINPLIKSLIPERQELLNRIIKEVPLRFFNLEYGSVVENLIKEGIKTIEPDIPVEIEEVRLKGDLSEHMLESIVIDNINKVEHGMKFIDRQVKIIDGVIDILARDVNDTLCIIELKVTDHNKDIVYQSVYYPSQYEENVRMITICPNYIPRIHVALKQLKYVEMKSYYFTESGELHIIDYLNK